MKLKKTYNNIKLYFDLRHNKIAIEKENILKNMIESLDCFKFIDKNKPFNDLIKEQQKHPKHILVDFVPKPLDEFKFIIKAVYNFLIETNQEHILMIDEMHVDIDDDELIIYSTECIRTNLNTNTTISPSIRACWVYNPKLIEHIIKRPSYFS